MTDNTMEIEEAMDKASSKTEFEGLCHDLQEEIRDAHAILDRLGSDSRNVKPDATKEIENRLPARLNRYIAETQGAMLKLLSGGYRG